jgi:phage-related protein
MQTVTGRVEAIALDLSDKFENKPTVAQLNNAAKSYMTSGKTALPAQTISVSFVQNDDPVLAKLQTCRLCDRVNLEFQRYGTSGRFKIVKTVWDVLGERYEEMELGTLSTSLSEALGISNGMGESSGRITFEIKDATSASTTLAAGATGWIAVDTPSAGAIYAGYYVNGAQNVSVYCARQTDTGAQFAVRNNGGSSATFTISARFLALGTTQ